MPPGLDATPARSDSGPGDCHRRQGGPRSDGAGGRSRTDDAGQRLGDGEPVCLGQVAGATGSNELGALPKLLELLDLNGAIVTLDALGCQKDIVAQIVEKKGDYVIAVKGNQEKLEAAVHATLGAAMEAQTAMPTITRRGAEAWPQGASPVYGAARAGRLRRVGAVERLEEPGDGGAGV